MIDWNSEAMKMERDFYDLWCEHGGNDAECMAEALCAERLGWA